MQTIEFYGYYGLTILLYINIMWNMCYMRPFATTWNVPFPSALNEHPKETRKVHRNGLVLNSIYSRYSDPTNLCMNGRVD